MSASLAVLDSAHESVICAVSATKPMIQVGKAREVISHRFHWLEARWHLVVSTSRRRMELVHHDTEWNRQRRDALAADAVFLGSFRFAGHRFEKR